MNTPEGNWVPKVHPLTRAVEPEDPMELMATPAPGDPDVMLECLVQEYAWMGWDPAQLLDLFQSPLYPVLNQLLAAYGEEEVRRRIGAVLARSGVFRVTAVVEEEPEPDDGPELIQLSIRKRG
jgi:hypothetical protein